MLSIITKFITQWNLLNNYKRITDVAKIKYIRYY